MFDICDMHSHILPAMDDGCKSAEESVAALKLAWEGGVRKLFATPHYYARERVEDFLARREVSFRLLQQRMDEEKAPLPQLCCGAEVAYFSGIGRFEGLERLCLGKSRYLLLELPFTPWNSQLIRDLNDLYLRGFTPILAHLERYLRCQSPQLLRRVLECEPLVQMNGEFVLDFWRGRQARTLLRKGTVHLLGSDCHNTTRRPPNLGEAVHLLEKKNMRAQLARIEEFSNEIFRDATAP